ncbi:MAG: extracellular solute-binding protein, partial [Chloroflexota bacterium]|nr:extracellular solute-binding protein [Chloroflexota bacterium]
MFRASFRFASIASALVLLLAACTGGGGSGAPASAASAKGPIKIWYSNNKEEVAWGKAVVAAWNKDHPNEQVTGEEIPAGKSSEEVIGASITAGNTPCLIFNTAPAAVPQFKKQGGLVALDDFPDAASYIKARTGDRADQYKFTDGKFYQMPWKTNPVMIFYNKTVFAKAGIATDNPPLKTYDEF